MAPTHCTLPSSEDENDAADVEAFLFDKTFAADGDILSAVDVDSPDTDAASHDAGGSESSDDGFVSAHGDYEFADDAPAPSPGGSEPFDKSPYDGLQFCGDDGDGLSGNETGLVSIAGTCPDTPVKKVRGRTAPPDCGTTGRRNDMVEDLGGEVLQIPVDYFFDGLLPALPEIGADAKVVENLIKTNKLRKDTGKGISRWRKWAKKPSQYTGVEDDVFQKLAQLIDDISEAYDPGRKTTLNFACKPKEVPNSTTVHSSSKPDAYGYIAPPDSRTQVDWIDIGVAGEFKKDKQDRLENDNRKKVMWSLNHMMREDPTRRFVYGFTIADTNMRMWYASRSEVFASFQFNFLMEPEKVVKFFLSLLYAEPHQLGWDPTIKRISPRDVKGPAVQYDIQVGDVWYRTQRLLSNAGAEVLRGRGTRVWEARKLEFSADGTVKEVGDSVVLKDSWADSDRLSEGRISGDIHGLGDANDQSIIEKCFTTVLLEADVEVKAGLLDHTHVVKREGLKPIEVLRLKILADFDAAKPGPKSGAQPEGIVSLPPANPPLPAQYSAKTHRRTVFKQVAKTIHQADSLYKAFACLMDVVKGLRMLHKNGWVHRDLSVGNILLDGLNGRITDVEYAKHKDDMSIHDVRTGTPYFMSIEVEKTDYMFRDFKGAVHQVQSRDDFVATLIAFEKARATGAQPQPPQPPVKTEITEQEALPLIEFRYNPLHDMESLLWVGLWMLVCVEFERNDTSISEEAWAAYMAQHRTIAHKIFDEEEGRTFLLLSTNALLTNFRNALPQVRELAMELNNYRSLVVDAFRKAEQSDRKKVEVLFDEDMYTQAEDIFQHMTTLLMVKPLDLVHRHAQVKQVKRMPKLYPKDADDDESGGSARPARKRRQTTRAVSAAAAGPSGGDMRLRSGKVKA